MKYYLDTYAIIECIKENPNFIKFQNEVTITGALNITETHYYLVEYSGEIEADNFIESLNFSLLEPNKEIAIKASKFRHKNKKLKMSYADCLGYIIAMENNLIFVTGDDAFKEFENVEFIK
jgi:predicted nucleic acid-binding protein